MISTYVVEDGEYVRMENHFRQEDFDSKKEVIIGHATKKMAATHDEFFDNEYAFIYGPHDKLVSQDFTGNARCVVYYRVKDTGDITSLHINNRVTEWRVDEYAVDIYVIKGAYYYREHCRHKLRPISSMVKFGLIDMVANIVGEDLVISCVNETLQEWKLIAYTDGSFTMPGIFIKGESVTQVDNWNKDSN